MHYLNRQEQFLVYLHLTYLLQFFAANSDGPKPVTSFKSAFVG